MAERSPDNVSKEHQTAEKPVLAAELANTVDTASVIGIYALIRNDFTKNFVWFFEDFVYERRRKRLRIAVFFVMLPRRD